MSYIYINLFSQRERGQLKPDEAIMRLREHFPKAIVCPEDQLLLSTRRAAMNLDQRKPANRAVVEKLAKDTQNLGPAYAFHIPAGPEPLIKGVVKRYQADFHSEAPLSAEMRTRVIAFLRSLIPTGMNVSVCDESD